MRVHLFTSAAANYLPKVRALFASLRRTHPDWRLHLVLADAPPPGSTLGGAGADEIHLISDLGIPDWRAWTFCHSLVELATALKPFMLHRLLARDDCDAAIYLDPDIVVFTPLAEIVEALARSEILLTPHQTTPEADLHGVIANEICTLQHGVYNLGFIAVANRPQGRAFARWWRDRAYRFCRIDVPNGLFTDQRWVDLAPALFQGVELLRAARLNVAPWNLSTRRLTGRAPNRLKVAGDAVGFFHFSGIDRRDLFAGRESDRTVEALVRWYRKLTKPSRRTTSASNAWAFDAFSDGEAILREQRLVYRLRGDLQRAYPDPFASGGQGFQAWWRGQARIEFPALFDPAARGTEIGRLSSALTTGYADLPD